jgi:hypothetical protein
MSYRAPEERFMIWIFESIQSGLPWNASSSVSLSSHSPDNPEACSHITADHISGFFIESRDTFGSGFLAIFEMLANVAHVIYPWSSTPGAVFVHSNVDFRPESIKESTFDAVTVYMSEISVNVSALPILTVLQG